MHLTQADPRPSPSASWRAYSSCGRCAGCLARRSIRSNQDGLGISPTTRTWNHRGTPAVIPSASASCLAQSAGNKCLTTSKKIPVTLAVVVVAIAINAASDSENHPCGPRNPWNTNNDISQNNQIRIIRNIPAAYFFRSSRSCRRAFTFSFAISASILRCSSGEPENASSWSRIFSKSSVTVIPDPSRSFSRRSSGESTRSECWRS